MSDNNMLLAQQRLLPVKINKEIFTFEIDGQVENREVLAAILNGKVIDTSASIDKHTGELLILDVEGGVAQ